MAPGWSSNHWRSNVNAISGCWRQSSRILDAFSRLAFDATHGVSQVVEASCQLIMATMREDRGVVAKPTPARGDKHARRDRPLRGTVPIRPADEPGRGWRGIARPRQAHAQKSSPSDGDPWQVPHPARHSGALAICGIGRDHHTHPPSARRLHETKPPDPWRRRGSIDPQWRAHQHYALATNQQRYLGYPWNASYLNLPYDARAHPLAKLTSTLMLQA